MESNQDRISKAILAVNHAIEQGEVLSVVTTLQSFFKEWNKDIVVNQFYRMSEYKSVLSEISSAKDSLVDCTEYKKFAQNDFRKAKIADCYELYQKELFL